MGGNQYFSDGARVSIGVDHRPYEHQPGSRRLVDARVSGLQGRAMGYAKAHLDRSSAREACGSTKRCVHESHRRKPRPRLSGPPSGARIPSRARWHILATGRAARPHDVNATPGHGLPLLRRPGARDPGESWLAARTKARPMGVAGASAWSPINTPAVALDLPSAPANIAQPRHRQIGGARAGWGGTRSSSREPRHVQSFAELSPQECLRSWGCGESGS